ncbi:putative glycoside hydrolase family 26 protein [Phaeoacremonium minimum UCRPA7]|uniref:Putative glycoside hydrolase family 26 protein n=1 Tax=Phaeoacremonium minimum (strain UCR-PA7) TaxID=1286976 RepID=R8BLC0_PHAM7|nr:putative glycoside hydrolase family 26 protein [Phaeoacremonium minimum UCRPA7]EOO00154.1 putative glycoside hydrolase family 26 protein [Phaeoacremonium minimum UCRPA7]
MHPPVGGMQGHNGIYWGWNPDIENGVNISMINKATGKKASTYGIFSQIKNANSYDGTQLLRYMDEIKSSDAVLVAHIMPTGLKFKQVGPEIAADIASVVKKFTDEGIEVWLRFAHEMNYYAKTGYYNGSSEEFIYAWRNVSNAVKENDRVLMFWSPNNVKSNDELDPWWPGSDYVQIVGVDLYISSASATFENTFGSFYDAFAKKYDKHMAIAETSTKPGDTSVKQAWVKALAGTDLNDYPCMKSVTWFELVKSYDYRIVMGQSSGTVKWTLSNFQ